MSHVTLHVNGTTHGVDIEPSTPLLMSCAMISACEVRGLVADWASAAPAR